MILTQPLSSSYAVIPNDHQSTGYEYPGPPSINAWNTSGAKKKSIKSNKKHYTKVR